MTCGDIMPSAMSPKQFPTGWFGLLTPDLPDVLQPNLIKYRLL
jgi:hypothetical protein